jgi:hypothetical protein
MDQNIAHTSAANLPFGLYKELGLGNSSVIVLNITDFSNILYLVYDYKCMV